MFIDHTSYKTWSLFLFFGCNMKSLVQSCELYIHQFCLIDSARSLTLHYNNVIMSEMASQVISISIICSTIHSGADQRKHQSSASLAFVREIHRWPANSPHKRPVTRKMLPFDDVILLFNTRLRAFVRSYEAGRLPNNTVHSKMMSLLTLFGHHFIPLNTFIETYYVDIKCCPNVLIKVIISLLF